MQTTKSKTRNHHKAQDKTEQSRRYSQQTKSAFIQALHALAPEPENALASGKISFRQVNDKHLNQRFAVGSTMLRGSGSVPARDRNWTEIP
jgi:hypothetical protein